MEGFRHEHAAQLIPGVSDAQASAIEAACLLADPMRHDGICAQINVLLGDTGGPYADGDVTTAISQAMNRYSGVAMSQIFSRTTEMRALTPSLFRPAPLADELAAAMVAGIAIPFRRSGAPARRRCAATARCRRRLLSGRSATLWRARARHSTPLCNRSW